MVGKPCLGKDLYATKKKLAAKLEEEAFQNFLKVTFILLPFTEYCRQILFSKDIDLYIAL